MTAQRHPGPLAECTDGTPLQIAAAAPEIPWTDLAYSLVPERRDPGLRGRTAPTTQGSIRRVEAVLRLRPLWGRGGDSRNFAPGRDRSQRRRQRLVRTRLTAGEPYEGDPTAQAIVGRGDGVPLQLLHRPLRGPGAAADLQRLHRRPVPGRRGDPLLQPHAQPSTRVRDISLMFFDHGHAAGRTRVPTRPCSTPPRGLVRPIT